MFNLSHRDFDLDKLKKIVDLGKTCPVTALECIERYVKKYPYDAWGYVNCANLLVVNDRVEEAQEKLNKAIYLYDNNYFYFMNPEKGEKLLHELLFAQLKIYAFKNDAASFLKLYAVNKDVLTNISDETLFYFKVQAGLRECPDVPISYTRGQMVQYSEDRLIECIKYKTSHVNGENNEAIKSCFKEDIDIKELIGKVKEKLLETKKLNTGLFTNSYLFKCDGCGVTADGEECNYFKVVTLNNTDNIINMNPVTEPLDLEFSVIERKKEEVKSYNMADRFRRRYGLTTA